MYRWFQIALLSVLAIAPLLLLGWFLKRRLLDRKHLPPGVANATRVQLMDLMNEDQRAGLEHQMYMEEDEEREADQGQDR